MIAEVLSPKAIVGADVAQRYRVSSLIGAGGMGAVFEAHDRERDLPVALKIMLPGDDPSDLARFTREARLASSIAHPNIVRIYDYGRAGDGRAVQFYIAMELVAGPPLGKLLDVGLSSGTVCALAADVLAALAHLHARGALHRDVKPDNVLIERDAKGRLRGKLSDFGIAALLDGESTRLTAEGMLLGTPAYMAPEQALPTPLPEPSLDLYPVGVIIYRILAKKLPFVIEDMSGLYAKTADEAPPPDNLEQWPAGLWDVVARLLAKAPERRPTNAAEAIAALEPFVGPAEMDLERWRTLGGARPAGQHGVTGSGARPSIWGRERDLDRLQEVVGEVESGSGRVVVLEGDAGIGKSHLASALGLALAEQGRFIRLTARFRASAGAVDALRSCLEGLLGTSGHGASRVSEAIEEFLRRHGESDQLEQLDLLRLMRPSLFATPPPEDYRTLAFALVIRVLRRLARRRPVLLLLDDIHKAGTEGAALLRQLLFETAYEAFPLLVVATVRLGRHHELAQALARDRDASTATALVRHQLAPLPSDVLAEGLREAAGLSPEQARRAARRAGGNPLYAHLLASSEQTAKDKLDGTAEQLPEELVRIISSSIDERLAPHPQHEKLRGLLERIALLGESVDEALAAAFVADLELDFDEAVDQLIGCNLLAEDPASDAIGFEHGLLFEALRLQLRGRRARRLHARAAQLREQHAGEHPNRHAAAIGDQWALAGKPDRALPWWLRALDYEAAAGAAQRAADCGERALDVIEPDDPRAPAVRLATARLQRELGHFDQAIELLEPLIHGTGDDDALCAGELLGELHQEIAEAAAWDELIGKLETRADGASERGRRALQRARLFWLNHRGKAHEAIAAGERLLAESPPGHESHGAFVRLVWSCMIARESDRAARFAQRALEEADEDLALRGEALRVLAFAQLDFGRFDRAAELSAEALELQRRAGRGARVLRAAIDHLIFLIYTGNGQRARALIEHARRIERGVPSPGERTRLELYALFTRNHFFSEDPPTAAQLRELYERLESVGLATMRPWTALELALAHCRCGSWSRAAELIDSVEQLGVWLLPEPLIAQLIEQLQLHARRPVPGAADLLERFAERVRAQRAATPGDHASVMALLDRATDGLDGATDGQ